MIKLLENTKELQQIYTFNNSPSYAYEYARNLGYKQGVSTWNDDYFNPYLNKLINAGILTKEYDFVKDGYREAVYTFSDDSQIEFFGENHMTMRIFYNY
jgi:hypothetical protein